MANKNFYTIGILLLLFTAAMGMFLGIGHFQIGDKVFYLPTFLVWFAIMALIDLLALSVLLKYYHHKKYSRAYILGMVYLISLVCHFIVFYAIISARSLEVWFRYTYELVLISQILYGLGLICSKTGTRQWLKAAGVFMVVLGSVQLLTFFWILNTENVKIPMVLQTVRSWNFFVNGLLPVPFILNFASERRAVDNEHGNATRSFFFKSLVVFAGIAVIITSLALIRDAIRFSDHLDDRIENANELAQPFEGRSYVNSQGTTMPYRLLKPIDYDPEKEYPLVICLHHGGGHGTDNALQIESSPGAQMLSANENRRKYPAFILVPQCPPGFTWGGIPDRPKVDTLVFGIIDALEKEFNIDQKRRYVMGVSMGGYGSWHFICSRPQLFAAAIPICGGGDPERAQKIVDIPIWAFHGENDISVPVGLSRDMIDAIGREGGNPGYIEFSGAGHDIWPQVSNIPQLLDWLFSQKRNEL
ncbi:MAG: hypothetical protein V7724_11220 [Sediminicola sp.]